MRNFAGRRIGALVAGLAMVTVGAVATGAPAQSAQSAAQDKGSDAGTVSLGAGTSFGKGTPLGDGSVGEADHCTVSAVGRDAEDRLVALSAAHCARDSVSGELIELWVEEQKVGQFVSAEHTVPGLPGSLQPGYYDFAFAVLDESKVKIASERGADVSAGLPAKDAKVGTFTKVCKSGMSTAQTCGRYIGNGGTTPREHIVALHMSPGDSGGPLYTEDGHLLGIASRMLPNYFGDVRDASAYALSKGWVGGGFEPIA